MRVLRRTTLQIKQRNRRLLIHILSGIQVHPMAVVWRHTALEVCWHHTREWAPPRMRLSTDIGHTIDIVLWPALRPRTMYLWLQLWNYSIDSLKYIYQNICLYNSCACYAKLGSTIWLRIRCKPMNQRNHVWSISSTNSYNVVVVRRRGKIRNRVTHVS